MNGVQRVAPSFVFDVALPSLDVYSDVSLTLGWYCNGHWKYATSMTIPLVLQFASTIYKWVRLEKGEHKKWTWIALVLQFWPQWRALRVMNLDFKKDMKFKEKKKELMREITTTEPFLEAWPSIIIMTIIWLSTMRDNSYSTYCSSKYSCTNHTYTDNECEARVTTICYLNGGNDTINNFLDVPPEYCANHLEVNTCAVFSGFGGVAWFFTTYAISIITGSLGITKFLQVGPFSVLSEKGPLNGLLRWRFVLAFFAVGSSMVTKGVFIAWNIFLDTGSSFIENALGTSGQTATLIAVTVLLIGTLTVPNLLFSLISIGCSTGFNRKFLEVILRYPASWMLPITTFFTIGPTKSNCSSDANRPRSYLGFSKKNSIINMILTVVMYAALISYFRSYDSELSWKMNIFFVILFVSLILNTSYFLLDLPCCYFGSNKCLCVCCCGPECYETNVHVIDASQNELEIVQIDG